MTFGYNADAAFGQSTAEVTDHAKSLLSSLIDKREEPEVQNEAKTMSGKDIDVLIGSYSSIDLHRTFSWRYCCETSMMMQKL